ncbi:uncharacterized protein [Halyomorpha halys]|uniref:uncharacterized protein isoform X2 n=1 Tax=Halyomorpha halys TaxID=286706 RepID=UPI0034D23F2D
MSLSSVFGNMLQIFLNEPSDPGKGQVYEDSRSFRRGLAIWKSKTRIVIPSLLILFMEFIMFLSVIMDAVTRPNLDWVDKIAEFCFIINTLIFYSITYFLRDDMDRLSESVDFWWSHTFLKQTREDLKKSSIQWMETFNNYFMSRYAVLPLAIFAISESKSYSELNIFKMWAPFLQQHLWTILLLYAFQVACIFFQFFGYGVLTAYMMSVSVACKYQTRLVEISCLTIKDRVLALVRKEQDISERKTLFCTIFLKEIAESAKHYQHVYRNWKEMCRLLSRMADVVFYSGMCIVIMFGVRVATQQENSSVILNSFLFIVVVICNQYLFTIINGTFTNQVISIQNSVYNCPWYSLPVSCQKSINLFQIMVSYIPTLSTFMGVEASREFFGRTINATYCYMSALVSMNRK